MPLEKGVGKGGDGIQKGVATWHAKRSTCAGDRREEEEEQSATGTGRGNEQGVWEWEVGGKQ